MKRFDEYIQNQKMSPLVTKLADALIEHQICPFAFVLEWAKQEGVEAEMLEKFNEEELALMEVLMPGWTPYPQGGQQPPAQQQQPQQQGGQQQPMSGYQAAGQQFLQQAKNFGRGLFGMNPTAHHNSAVNALNSLMNTLGKVQGQEQLVSQIKEIMAKIQSMRGDVDKAQQAMSQVTQYQQASGQGNQQQ